MPSPQLESRAMAMVLGIPLPSQLPSHLQNASSPPPFPSPIRADSDATLKDEDHARSSSPLPLDEKHRRRTPELPPHWRDEFDAPRWLQPVLRLAFTTLCMVALGHRTLAHKWAVTHSDTEAFAKDKELISNRITTISVVVRRAATCRPPPCSKAHTRGRAHRRACCSRPTRRSSRPRRPSRASSTTPSARRTSASGRRSASSSVASSSAPRTCMCSRRPTRAGCTRYAPSCHPQSVRERLRG